MNEELVFKVALIARRKDRFTYDLRSTCFVYDGVVAAYKATKDSDHFTDLPLVIAHALEHDGIVGAWRDPESGERYYDSCRVFTDVRTAAAFARKEKQQSIYHLTRDIELQVDPVR